MAKFSVEVRCFVSKTVEVECEDELEAYNNPWEHEISEIETDMISWEVQSVKKQE